MGKTQKSGAESAALLGRPTADQAAAHVHRTLGQLMRQGASWSFKNGKLAFHFAQKNASAIMETLRNANLAAAFVVLAEAPGSATSTVIFTSLSALLIEGAIENATTKPVAVLPSTIAAGACAEVAFPAVEKAVGIAPPVGFVLDLAPSCFIKIKQAYDMFMKSAYAQAAMRILGAAGRGVSAAASASLLFLGINRSAMFAGATGAIVNALEPTAMGIANHFWPVPKDPKASRTDTPLLLVAAGDVIGSVNNADQAAATP